MIKRNIISIIMVMLIILNMIPASIAVGNNVKTMNDEKELNENKSFVENIDEIAYDFLNDDCRILNYIDNETFDADSFAHRLRNQEDLNTYVFVSQDGEKTVFIFDENVKYVDTDGIVREKDLSLIETDFGYTTVSNDIVLQFPESLEKGIVFKYNGNFIEIHPELKNKAKAKLESNSVLYDRVFGSDTALKYTPDLTGLKEDIILYSSNSPAKYIFEISVRGMELYSDDGRYYFASVENPDEIMNLGNIIVYDSNAHYSDGQIKVQKITEHKYMATITIDESFLNDEETVFPVTIDPSLTVSDNTYGINSIQDASVFQNLPNTNAGSFFITAAGTMSSVYGIGRTVVRLSGLTASSEYSSVTASQISNVTFYAFESSNTSAQTINLHPISGASTWTESDVTWNTIANNYNSAVNFGASSPSGQWTAFDITNLVKGWKSGIYNAACGFMLKNSNESNNKTFNSSENNTTSTRPYVVMTFTNSVQSGVYTLSKQNSNSYASSSTSTGGTYVSQISSSTPPLSESVKNALFKIIYRPSTDDYVIRNMINNEIVIYADEDLYSPIAERLENVDDANVQVDKAWKITGTNDGYYNISCTLNSSTYYMCMPTSGSLTLTTNPNNSGAEWTLTQYTGTLFRGWGQINSWPEHIENGSEATIQAYIYSTVIGENRAKINGSAVNPDVAEVYVYPYSAKMKITPRYGGSTKIQIEANSGSAIFGTHYIMSGWDEGSFFIKNLYNGDYLTEPGGNSNTELRLITLPSGTNKEYTLWNMHYYANGYYQIIQDVSTDDCVYGYNTTSTSICGMPWASTPYQQTLWKFIPIGDGMFKIQNQYHETNNPNYFISLNNTATKDICFLSNSGVKMLWNIIPMKLNINVLFDQAFVDRHTGYGYLSVLNSVFVPNQNSYSIIANLLNRLGVHASYEVVSTATNTYESYPYTTDCELLGSSDFSEFCYNDQEYEPYNCDNQDHSTEDNDCLAGYHHKNGNRILGEMQTISRLSSTNARILFTGFNCCNYDYNNHVHTPSSYVISGWAYGEATKCLIMPCQDMKRVAQHELVHILGAPDCGTGNTNNCIMGHNQLNEDVVSEMIICPSCIETIKLLKYSFYNH